MKRDSRSRNIIFSAVISVALVSCSDAPTDSMARQHFEASQGEFLKKGVVIIDSFSKTNGLKHLEGGVESYAYEFKAELSFPKGLMPECVDDSHFDINCFGARNNGVVPRKPGAHETKLGKIIFEKAENGWRALGVDTGR